MNNRTSRQLVVKCSLDSWNKKITFDSARNCTYDLLRQKVEQCYSLSSSSFAITYKDDDGEITTIAGENDLTEAIQYFQAGDDPPLSSAASILSGRSFGSRKVTLKVQITVDYDGPSLSDTSSLISLEEYRGRNGSQQSFSFGPPSVVDDDSMTVSSRDNSGVSTFSRLPPPRNRTPGATSDSLSKSYDSRVTLVQSAGQDSRSATFKGSDLFSDVHNVPASSPQDNSAVFERLRRQEELGDDLSSVNSDSLGRNYIGSDWLKDQNERAIRKMLGGLPEPSVSDDVSVTPQTEYEDELAGALALEQDSSGRYYYTYTSGSSASQTHGSTYDDGGSGAPGEIPILLRPRPSSMHLNWLASQQVQSQDAHDPKVSLSVPSFHTHNSDPLPAREIQSDGSQYIVDKELRQFLPPTLPPPDTLTDCSSCGTLLDAIRYVCSTCGEKYPVASSPISKGKRKANHSPTHTYPPQPLYHQSPSSSPVNSNSSHTFLGSSESLSSRHLPSLPSSPHLVVPGVPSSRGYELCSGCLESAGVHHAIETGLASSSSPVTSVTAHGDAQAASQWRRAPPKKGELRHAFLEKFWSHSSWEDVEQDEAQISKCSTCQAKTSHKRYKCASCPNINLCRACYRPSRPLSEPDHQSNIPPDPHEEQSLKHPGVKCFHCLLDIVGARFHCAICDFVDICSNCESAGLPGNLDSADGGHISSHILIKIPYPLEISEVRSLTLMKVPNTYAVLLAVGKC
ncbi:hypothetical protein H0H87_009863 [Tephrocybe sp. NHM501043]|nr:hypothetical protein H0H87_009863 [Tephrocybe sp. NHM501043]